MKVFSVVVVLLVAVAGGAWHLLLEKEKTKQQEIAVRKQESREAQAKHEAKAAESLKGVFTASNRIVQAWVEKAKAEADAKAAEALEAESKQKLAEAEKAKAVADADARDLAAATAEENRKAAESLREAETAKRDAAQAALRFVETTNATRMAELAQAERANERLALEARNRELAVKQMELLKADYERRIADIAELQELLRQREEETRPEMTVADLATTDDEMPEILGTVITNKPPVEPATLSGANALLASAQARRVGTVSNLVTRARNQVTEKLESLACEAAKAGDEARAAYYLRQLKILYPDYDPRKSEAPRPQFGTNCSTEEEKK